MNYDNLLEIDSKCKKSNLIRILSIPCSAIAGIIIGAIISILSNNTASFVIVFPATIAISYLITNSIFKSNYKEFEKCAFSLLGISGWKFSQQYDDRIQLKSKQALSNYTATKYFKEDTNRLSNASKIMGEKNHYASALDVFIHSSECNKLSMYKRFVTQIEAHTQYTHNYRIFVFYSSPTGKSFTSGVINLSYADIANYENDKSLLMSKSEYNKYLKEQEKEKLANKQHKYYKRVNKIIDLVNDKKDSLVIKNDQDELDRLVASLFDRTVNSIKKIKSTDSEEWYVIEKLISNVDKDVNSILEKNKRITDYYKSDDFIRIKDTCNTLMSTQREFNDYIDEKVKSISSLFGTNIARNETSYDDEFNYIHPYKKSITPFTAEVSSTVFSSAENNPLDYVVKTFYPDKSRYPEQIQKLHLLIEELETLKEAKTIIEGYKIEVDQYITNVPSYIMELDEDGFYSRLGFATINENSLTVQYKFSYTSNGGKAQRSFTVPMTEDTIIGLIGKLESKLTMSSFTKEQRSLMTSKLRQMIKERDQYTCKLCGNSTHAEPNLLLEIDHIIPVSRGGYTEESNLQTLCWKCNRSKSNKIAN